MTDIRDERLHRVGLLVHGEGLARLAAAHVCVVGLGGVGGACALALARSGVGELTLIDGDAVELSNFNRQVIANARTLGMQKPLAAQALIADINPDIAVHAVYARLAPEDAVSAVPEGCSYVIDCIDDIAVKVALAKGAEQRGYPLLSSMGTARKWRPDMLRCVDITETRGCKVAKIMRKELKKAGVEHLRVVYSEEIPSPQEGDPRPLGSTAFVPQSAGIMLASIAVRAILGEVLVG